jgi:hypothetical protein
MLRQFKDFEACSVVGLTAHDVRCWTVDTMTYQPHFIGIEWLTDSDEIVR